MGFQVDKARAIRCYKKAVTDLTGTEMVTRSYEALGQMYETGEGVGVDIRQAFKCYLLAAEQLSSRGQWKAAIALEKGLGQGRNKDRAIYFFKLCARAGHKGAQHKMQRYYLLGHGVEGFRARVLKIKIEDVE